MAAVPAFDQQAAHQRVEAFLHWHRPGFVAAEIAWYVAATARKKAPRSQGDTWRFEYGSDPLHSDKFLVSIQVSKAIGDKGNRGSR